MTFQSRLMTGMAAALLVSSPAFAKAGNDNAQANPAAKLSPSQHDRSANSQNGETRGNGEAMGHEKARGRGHEIGRGNGHIKYDEQPDSA